MLMFIPALPALAWFIGGIVLGGVSCAAISSAAQEDRRRELEKRRRELKNHYLEKIWLDKAKAIFNSAIIDIPVREPTPQLPLPAISVEHNAVEPATVNVDHYPLQIRAGYGVSSNPDVSSNRLVAAGSKERSEMWPLPKRSESKQLLEIELSGDVTINNPEAIYEPIVRTMVELAKHPQPIFYSDSQRPYSLEDFDDSKGSWESAEKQAKRRKVKVDTLANYREAARGAVSLGNGIVRDAQGFFCKQENEKPNAPFIYFVPDK